MNAMIEPIKEHWQKPAWRVLLVLAVLSAVLHLALVGGIMAISPRTDLDMYIDAGQRALARIAYPPSAEYRPDLILHMTPVRGGEPVLAVVKVDCGERQLSAKRLLESSPRACSPLSNYPLFWRQITPKSQCL